MSFRIKKNTRTFELQEKQHLAVVLQKCRDPNLNSKKFIVFLCLTKQTRPPFFWISLEGWARVHYFMAFWTSQTSPANINVSLPLQVGRSQTIYRWTWIWRTTVRRIFAYDRRYACMVPVRCISSIRHMYTTDFAYDGPIFLVPLSPSYQSSPVLIVFSSPWAVYWSYYLIFKPLNALHYQSWVRNHSSIQTGMEFGPTRVNYNKHSIKQKNDMK